MNIWLQWRRWAHSVRIYKKTHKLPINRVNLQDILLIGRARYTIVRHCGLFCFGSVSPWTCCACAININRPKIFDSLLWIAKKTTKFRKLIGFLDKIPTHKTHFSTNIAPISTYTHRRSIVNDVFVSLLWLWLDDHWMNEMNKLHNWCYTFLLGSYTLLLLRKAFNFPSTRPKLIKCRSFIVYRSACFVGCVFRYHNFEQWWKILCVFVISAAVAV